MRRSLEPTGRPTVTFDFVDDWVAEFMNDARVRRLWRVIWEIAVHHILDVHDELICIFGAVLTLLREKFFEQCNHRGGNIGGFSLKERFNWFKCSAMINVCIC